VVHSANTFFFRWYGKENNGKVRPMEAGHEDEKRHGRLAHSVRRTRGPNGGTLLHIFSGEMYRLNPVASRILDLVEDGCEEDEIVRAIQNEFQVDGNLAKADVSQFLIALKERGLIGIA
jgi:hypothetical protein